MKIIDPNYLMETIKISPETPKHIAWIVKMLKGMVMFGDANLQTDKTNLVTFFINMINNYFPQKLLWGMTIDPLVFDKLYDEAVKWIKEVEKLE